MIGGLELDALERLARHFGVCTVYRDQWGAERRAAPEPLAAVLAALGAPLSAPADAPAAWRDVEARGPALTTAATVAVWGDVAGRVTVVVPATDGGADVAVRALDDADPAGFTARVTETDRAGDVTRVVVEVTATVPIGAHRLALDVGAHRINLSVLVAPERAPTPRPPGLGVFVPLYALHGRRHEQIGDLGDLATLAAWATAAGAPLIGTLPLLATFLDEPFDPTPYAPVSRMFWNELYADLAASPDLPIAPAARRLLETDAAAVPPAPHDQSTLVDYRLVWARRRVVLEALATAAFADPRRRGELESIAASHPHLDDYARFRAAGDMHRTTWDRWPAAMRDGRIERDDVDPVRWRTHVYAQWLMEHQLARLATKTDDAGGGLYLDLPIGVHARGYDAWRFREQFVPGLSVGAPPDQLFTGGQDWGFPPPHPEVGQRDGQSLFRAVAAHHVRHAAVLRVDHVMGLHRLFCIPHGMDATDGVYVHQPGEELFAALCIEAHRRDAVLVGENLGTVPPETHDMLERRGILGMRVAQFEFREHGDDALPAPPAGTLACVNTHDLPTFAGYWRGRDLAILTAGGVFDESRRRVEQRRRARQWVCLVDDLTRRGLLAPDRRDAVAVFEAVLHRMAEGDAELLIVNLEDLWGETEPQNVPGPGRLWPSWRRRSGRTLETITGDAGLGRLLSDLT